MALFSLRVGPWSLHRRLRRQYEASDLHDREVEWRITETALRIRDPHGSADLTWGAFIKGVRTPAGLMLHSQPNLFHWLPRTAFAAEVEFTALADLARRRLATYRELR